MARLGEMCCSELDQRLDERLVCRTTTGAGSRAVRSVNSTPHAGRNDCISRSGLEERPSLFHAKALWQIAASERIHFCRQRSHGVISLPKHAPQSANGELTRATVLKTACDLPLAALRCSGLRCASSILPSASPTVCLNDPRSHPVRCQIWRQTRACCLFGRRLGRSCSSRYD